MKVWIDLTDFLSWTGNLTGIQRIQYNLSKFYIESSRDVRFFVYSEAKREFSEVSFDPDDIVKSGIISSGSAEVRQVSASRKAMARLLPTTVKRALHRSSIPSIVSGSERTTSSLFGRDDLVLIMGGIWAGNFISDLDSHKKVTGFKLIHFAFDMIPTVCPGYVVEWLPEAFRNYQKKVYSIAEGIVAISQSTASDIEVFIKENDIQHNPRVRVVRIGEAVDARKVGGVEGISLGLSQGGFILSVSTIEGRKNHTALFYAVKEARRRNIVLPKIVIVGRNGWLTDDIRYIIAHDPDAKECIMVLNDINDQQLSWLYENCLFTVFPSFYEGWGMPIAESLSYGKLCISSETSSMQEIAGDLIDYFSPYDTGELLRCLQKYLNPDTLKEKEKQIKQEYKPTSWQDMYDQVDTFVDEILSRA